MSTKDTEREHCEDVAEDITREHVHDTNLRKWQRRIANLIARERAAARAEALEEAATRAAQLLDGGCAWIPEGIRALATKTGGSND